MNYRRLQFNNPNDQYFLTCVTRDRLPIFASSHSINASIEQWKRCAKEAEGQLIANAIMPDHHHVVIEQGSMSFSNWVRQVKRRLNFLLNKNKGTLWQARFWEHRIRDEHDLIKAIEYIHYNPVKHLGIISPSDSNRTSFLDYVKEGFYPLIGQVERIWKQTIIRNNNIVVFSESDKRVGQRSARPT